MIEITLIISTHNSLNIFTSQHVITLKRIEQRHCPFVAQICADHHGEYCNKAFGAHSWGL